MARFETLIGNTEKLLEVSGEIRKFVNELLDENSFVETDVFLSGDNSFYDTIPFGEGVITGYGTINGAPVYIAAQNGEVFKGSFGKAHAEKILKCINRAIKNSLPLISIIDSAGVRVGEGLTALDGYAKIITAVNSLRDKSHHISVIKGTSAGLMAVYSSMSDFVFMSNAASLSLNPPMAVFASAGIDEKACHVLGLRTHASKSGISIHPFDTAVEVRDSLTSLFEYLDEKYIINNDDPNRVTEELNDNITTELLISALVDDGKYFEMYDAYSPDIKTILASVNSVPVGVLVTNVGGKYPKLTKTAIKKIRNFVKFLTKYNISLINLVDCEGMESSLNDEEHGITIIAAKMFKVLADADITKISVVTGSAIGFAYTALCSKAMGYNYVLAFPESKLSAMTAEAAINFMYGDKLEGLTDPMPLRAALKEKYDKEESNPFLSAKDGSVDNIIEPALLRPHVASALTMAVKK